MGKAVKTLPIFSVSCGFSGYSTDRVKEFLNDWSEIMNKSGQGKIRISLTASTAYLKLMADNGWVTKRALSLWLKNSRNRNQVLKDLETEGYIRSLRINDRVQAKRRQYRIAKKEGNAKAPEYLASLPTTIHGIRYALLPNGRDILTRLNLIRYGGPVLDRRRPL